MAQKSESKNPDESNQGLIFNIQGLSLHDGPGIRTTVFMKGCSLRCQWCSNPESISRYPEIMLFDKRCIKCGKCIEACPKGAISVVHDRRTVNWEKCDQCLKCAEVCPAKAIERVGTYITQEELVTEIEKDRLYYDNSGGGVTFSGGEPLVQWKFVLAVLKKCKERNIHTALDTTGNINRDIFENVLQYVDLVLYDIKHLDIKRHKEKTGIDNRVILENVKRINRNVKLWLRIPIIPGYNDSPEYIRKLGEFAANIRMEKVSLMPFHNWADQKYERLGRIYSYKEVPAVKEEEMEEHKKILQAMGLEVSIGR